MWLVRYLKKMADKLDLETVDLIACLFMVLIMVLLILLVSVVLVGEAVHYFF